MTAATVMALQPTAAQRFITAANDYVAALDEIATSIQQSEPGTATLLVAYAQRAAGAALDLVQRWP